MLNLNAGAFEFVPRTVCPTQPPQQPPQQPPSQPPAFARQEESAPTFSFNIGVSKPSHAPAPAAAPPAFVRRDEPVDAPGPPPTSSLSIGGSKPAAPPTAKPTEPPHAAAALSLDSVPETKASKEAGSTRHAPVAGECRRRL